MAFRSLRIFSLLITVLAPTLAVAQPRPADVAGARDHPLVGRYEGSTIAGFFPRGYDEIIVPDKLVRSPAPGGPRLNPETGLALSGRAVRIQYRGPEGRSTLEVVRSIEAQLKARGFETVFFCRAAECGPLGSFWLAFNEATPVGRGFMNSNWDSQAYLLARLPRPEGDVHVAWMSVQSGAMVQSVVDVVESRPMETNRVVFVDAPAMQSAIRIAGKVALYGILFDTDRAEIKPESKATLDEIAKVLRETPALNVIVAGHTDAQGAFDYNVDLSRRRAAAVVAALTSSYGIAPARLIAFGAGMAAPVASNDDEAGRARNRRVEIVKR